jgi:UDP-3-O-[3-hydroxymyristoyl] glucosamine N-acyltransferase
MLEKEKFGMEILPKDFLKIQKLLKILDKNKIKYNFFGNKEIEINGFSNIKNIKNNTICYSDTGEIDYSESDIVLICKDRNHLLNSLVVEDPKVVFYKLSNLIKFQNNSIFRSIHKTCQIGQNVVVGNSHIGKNVIIGHNVVIGDGVFIGDNTIIDSNCSIGCLGISWTWDNDEKVFLNAYGNTIIGKKCVISSNVKIVRGIFTNDTKIGDCVFIAPGTAIGHSTSVENKVHIANNCTIGGSCVIGQESFLGCGSTVSSGAKLNNGAIIGAGCVVASGQTLDSRSVYVGIPAKKIKTIQNNYCLKNIPKKEI